LMPGKWWHRRSYLQGRRRSDGHSSAVILWGWRPHRQKPRQGCGGGLCAIGQRCVSWEILSATALWGWWGWNEKPRSQTLGRHQIVICAPSVSLDIHIEEGGMTWFMSVCQLLQNYLAMWKNEIQQFWFCGGLLESIFLQSHSCPGYCAMTLGPSSLKLPSSCCHLK
jgi:hypothetical protein